MRVLCVLFAVPFAIASVAAQLDLPNPSFEIDEDGDGIPDGWRLLGAVEHGSGRLDDTQATEGRRSLKLVGNSPEARIFLEAPRLQVEPGGAYVFECQVKSESVASGAPTIGVARHTAEGAWDDWSYVFKAPPNRDWQHYRQVFIVPQTTAYIGFRVWIERLEGTAWFDEVKLSGRAGQPSSMEELVMNRYGMPSVRVSTDAV